MVMVKHKDQKMSKDNLDLVALTVETGLAVARKASQDFFEKHGDMDCCGFAWTTVYEKGNTKLGRALIAAGFKKAYGSGLQFWNPGGSNTQSISVKEEGAQAFAKFLREHLGVKAYASSRMD
jgi:phage-related protein